MIILSSVREPIHKQTHLSLTDRLRRQQGWGTLGFKPASDKEEGRGLKEGNLVKMLDDLGQHLTPEIIDWSAAST